MGFTKQSAWLYLVSCLSFWKGVVRGELHFLHAHPIKNIEEEIQEGVTTPTFFRSIFCRWTNTIGNYDFDVKKVNDAKIRMIVIIMHNSKQEKIISISIKSALWPVPLKFGRHDTTHVTQKWEDEVLFNNFTKKVLGKLIDVLKSFAKSEMFWILEDF